MNGLAKSCLLAAALTAAVGISGCGGGTPRAAGATPAASTSSTTTPLTVTSTLDGKTALPHRIHWQAHPRGGFAISEVDFLIDGKKMWTEYNAPYFYGDDGNYLVTSFLTPGSHVFTVKAVGISGSPAVDAVTATVPRATAPPSALARTWAAHAGGGADGAPTGLWRLSITAEGWQIAEPASSGGANEIDAAYLSPGLVEVRTGMATGNDQRAGKSADHDLNGWCNGEAGPPVRYRWTVTGNALTFRFVSGHPCQGFTQFLTGRTWKLTS